MAKFERKDARVTVAFLTCVREKWNGEPFNAPMAARAIKEREGWRVDRTEPVSGVWLPWEPIVDTPFPTLAAAKKEIRAFERACRLKPGSAERKQYRLSGAATRRRKRRAR